ncbi:hypothetical protein Hanom_Chr07g00633651 [Helianthus anomalus]
MFVGAGKSSKSTSRFSVTDIQEYASPRSLKKELAASQSIPESKGVNTMGILNTKILYLQKFTEVQILIDQHVAEVEQKCLDLQAIAVAKDKKIFQLENEHKALRKELLVAEMTAQMERIEVMEGAKH